MRRNNISKGNSPCYYGSYPGKQLRGTVICPCASGCCDENSEQSCGFKLWRGPLYDNKFGFGKTNSDVKYQTKSVNPKIIISFLSNYQTHRAAQTANPMYLKRYIEKQNDIDELTNWSVLLKSNLREKWVI